MKTKLLHILFLMLIAVYAKAQDEPDFYYKGLGYNILSESEQTCEIGKSQYGGEVTTIPTVEYKGKQYTVLGVGKNAFGLSNCTQVYVGNGLTYIEDDAFLICSNLRKATIGASILDLGSNCFGYNSKMEEVVVEDATEKLVFQSTMHNFCPFNQTNIKKLYVGRNFSKEIFKGWCNTITNLTIGDNVTTFELSNFPSLRKLTVGKNLEFLPYMNTGNYLTEVRVTADTPQSIGGFNKHTYLYATLYVPEGSKSLYEEAPCWSEFMEIKEYKTTNGIVATENDDIVESYYNIDGTRSKKQGKGLKIIRKSNGKSMLVINK